ncbi:MAG TPA: molybdate ABC transporter substrate-binding protein [Xanthobacteraceae bacterium]|nr:molybdate ABC transporter substrate-binding protein [Xanthobacteraceae bacterium]
MPNRRAGTLALALALALSLTPAMAHADQVLLHAAGSLRVALDLVAAAYEKATGVHVVAKYGASGTLREEIETGSRAEVFASANMEHPLALNRAGRSGPVVLFVRNQLCALARPGLSVEPASLLDRMMDKGMKLGTSTPKADPSGDYAWEAFRKADAIRPGAFAALSHKALQLTGAPSSVAAPADRNLYGMLVGQGRADLFLTYCTNALAAVRENPGQRLVALPDNLAVGADYGLTVMTGASLPAYRFALYVLSPDAQHIFANLGFAAPGVPH